MHFVLRQALRKSYHAAYRSVCKHVYQVTCRIDYERAGAGCQPISLRSSAFVVQSIDEKEIDQQS